MTHPGCCAAASVAVSLSLSLSLSPPSFLSVSFSVSAAVSPLSVPVSVAFLRSSSFFFSFPHFFALFFVSFRLFSASSFSRRSRAPEKRKEGGINLY
jgi:hypothetical protein